MIVSYSFSCSMAKSFMPHHLLMFLLFLSFFSLSSSQTSEIQALLQFKNQLKDPTNYLENWKESESPCLFFGILCDQNTGTITGISLQNLSLSGEISPSISALRNLNSLVLAQNSISGSIPLELVNCTNLQVLNLSVNSLTGPLPDLSPLRNLRLLDLSTNNFFGQFPVWIGNLSGLTELGLGEIPFDMGKIPESIGNLKNLAWLFLGQCNFIGEIPSSIFELRLLGTLDFSRNQISGTFPKSITNLTNLFKIELYQNNLTGEIPPEISNLTLLSEFDISRNQMTGILPAEIGNLNNLVYFQLYENRFWGTLPTALGDLHFLKGFSVYENSFSGEFPANLGRFSPLYSIDISENKFTGPFPRFLCESNNLQYLLALENNFSGEFPDSYAVCKTLVRFRISKNSFTGKVPDGLWGLPFAVIIDVSYNGFTGGISSNIGFSASLNQLCLQNNFFSGKLPTDLGKLSKLQKLFAFNNSFSGEIPSEIGNLNQLTSLHLEENAISGSIPYTLGNCNNLIDLNLASNSLTGKIPESLSSLNSLNSLNLSRNMLIGMIPRGLQSLKLSSIDFSNNQISGEVPSGLLVIAGDEAFNGNMGLCVGNTPGNQVSVDVPKCKLSRHKDILGKRLVLGSIILSVLVVLLAGLIVVGYKSFKMDEASKRIYHKEEKQYDPKWRMESFHEIKFDAEEICNLEEENLIGSGGTGKVYRLDLRKSGGTVAVKKLWKGNRAKVLVAEMDILGKIRHRNILKLYACLIREGSGYLVFEYMPNGNLQQALRREVKGGKSELEWNQRHKIAVGAAKGFMYLHHDCEPAIIHRDIKSSNILLDEDYEAKIADFGIAKHLEGSDMSCFAGTHGYIAPELAYSLKVTEKSDVYSFGVVLLELVTGHGPIDPEYGEGKDIVYWVSTHLSGHRILEVLDPRVSDTAEGEMLKVLQVGILCTTKLPSLRPTMREVVNMLIDAAPRSTVVRRTNYGKK